MGHPTENHKPGDGAQAEAGDSPVGTFLREERQAQGYTLNDVSSVINVRVGQLDAIEKGQLEKLPGMAYALGFVRSYAQYLQLDPDEIVKYFKHEHNQVPEKPELVFPVPVSESRIPSPLVVAGAAIGAVLLIVLWVVFSGDDEEGPDIMAIPAIETPVVAAVSSGTDAEGVMPVSQTPETETAQNEEESTVAQPAVDDTTGTPQTIVAAATQPETVPDSAAQAVPSAPQIAEPAPVEAPAPVAAQPKAKSFGEPRWKSRVSLKAVQASWVQVSDRNGKVIFKKLLKPGEIYRAPDEAGLSLVTANSGGLEVYIDGKQRKPIGKQGEIVRNLSLDPDKLAKYRPKRKFN